MAGAPCPREGVDKIDKLPSRPEKHTIYLLPDVGSRPRRPFPCLCYDPEQAVVHPDRYYAPRTLTHAQLMLAWRTYRLQKLRRLRWRSRLLEKAPSIYYFAFDEAERLLDFNTALGQAVRALVGRSPRRGQPFWDIVLPENQPSLREELRLLREGRALQLQRQVGPRRAEVCLMPLHKGVYGYYALDITVYHQLAELAMQQQSLQEEILGHLNEGLVVLDAQGKVLYVNPRAERFLGLSALEALGHPYPFSTQENLLVKGGRILETTSIPLPRAAKPSLCCAISQPSWASGALQSPLSGGGPGGTLGRLYLARRGRGGSAHLRQPLGAAMAARAGQNPFRNPAPLPPPGDKTPLQTATASPQAC